MLRVPNFFNACARCISTVRFVALSVAERCAHCVEQWIALADRLIGEMPLADGPDDRAAQSLRADECTFLGYRLRVLVTDQAAAGGTE